MATGTPISLKCPSCRRGKWGFSRIIQGVQKLDAYEKNHHRTGSGHGAGQGFNGHRRRVRCLDCGHEWFSTLAGMRIGRLTKDDRIAFCLSVGCTALDGPRGRT